MRPRTLDEVRGQEHIIGEGRLLRRAIMADRLSSLIFYGPPGTGKTTLARVIANSSKRAFRQLSAVTAGVADIRRVVTEAEDLLGLEGKATILFIDEIHRFNKAQQDALLPHVEAGTLILIGATTENPYFTVNTPLLSRSRVFRLHPLSDCELREIMMNALTDKERGLGQYQVELSEEAVAHFIRVANGDARSALNALELAVLTTAPDSMGVRRITADIAAESTQERILAYDKNGDAHYDTISAFIKSMRGSDPDAALYWLARMIKAGEDPDFIARRIIICAAEDVGNADPNALLLAVAAAQAANMVGWPEARIPLAQAVTYIACAPKGNAVTLAIDAALNDVANEKNEPVPVHLRDSSYRGAEQLGHGKGYKYPHDYPGHFVRQQYLPSNLLGRRYYRPSESGYENTHRRRLEQCYGQRKEGRE
ncbi:MAG: replication-associated recombination protein A [Firmicutes bacterium]|nr:replication-associated recombination protein A [Bacillota bacterium]